MHRRQLLRASLGSAGLLGLDACTTLAGAPLTRPRLAPPALAQLHASMADVFDITVCLRPFRAKGPRIETETVGDARVTHNYGHGGSGWSLSWGSARLALRQALSSGPSAIAIVGCGALGLTTAVLAQEAGVEVTLYARELLPDTRSARATGSWTPDSRIALREAAGAGFGDVWEEMARFSYKRFRRYLGLPGDPVEWVDRYTLSDEPPGTHSPSPNPLGFGHYESRLTDIEPAHEDLTGADNPFPSRYARRSPGLIFNLADYGHTLMGDFRAAGGRIVHREFHEPAEFGRLPEKVVVNCTGYGARALWRDESVTPVRGQIGWLTPQPAARYGLFWEGVSVVPRRDGIVVQDVSGGDQKGYGDDHEVIDRAETEHAVAKLAALFGRTQSR